MSRAATAERNRRREARWREQRFSVPYPVDGPKISLGVAWFATLMVAAGTTPATVGIVLVPVAAVAGLQAGHAWETRGNARRSEPTPQPRTQPTGAGNRPTVGLPGIPGVEAIGAATCAGAISVAGWFGALGVGVACLVGVAGLVVYGMISAQVTSTPPQANADPIRNAEVLVRSAIPAGVTAGSLLVLAQERTGAFVGLVLLISAYEVGDFLVGSGAANAVEGPIAGLVVLGVMAAGIYLVLPGPFTTTTWPLFAALAGVCAPLGQILASAILPRGDSWAPALRRLDSYLVAAPLWLLLV